MYACFCRVFLGLCLFINIAHANSLCGKYKVQATIDNIDEGIHLLLNPKSKSEMKIMILDKERFNALNFYQKFVEATIEIKEWQGDYIAKAKLEAIHELAPITTMYTEFKLIPLKTVECKK